jgi:hypothetical protein
MNWWIATFLVAGVLFGLATFSRRHHFSEGPTRRPAPGAPRDPLDGPWLWVALCSLLWPLFAVTGLYTALRKSRRG